MEPIDVDRHAQRLAALRAAASVQPRGQHDLFGVATPGKLEQPRRVLVVVGGTIPNDDADELKQQGVAEVFTPGAPTSEIVEFLTGRVPVT